MSFWQKILQRTLGGARVTAFSVNPFSATLGNSVAATFTVTDRSGAGLKRIELWRTISLDNVPAPDEGRWEKVSEVDLVGKKHHSGALADLPLTPATYWYSLHLFSNGADEFSCEPRPPGPVKVTIAPRHGVAPSPGASIEVGSRQAPAGVEAGGATTYRTAGSGGAREVFIKPSSRGVMNEDKGFLDWLEEVLPFRQFLKVIILIVIGIVYIVARACEEYGGTPRAVLICIVVGLGLSGAAACIYTGVNACRGTLQGLEGRHPIFGAFLILLALFVGFLLSWNLLNGWLG